MFRKFRRRPPEEEREKHLKDRRHIRLISGILMVIGALTVLYFFITEVLMRILAALTP